MAKRKTHHHFLRQWREAKDLSLEEVAEKIELLSAEWASEGESRPRTMTHATLSRIERGKIPYNQHLLELLADIYDTIPACLLMRDPQDPEGMWEAADQLSPAEVRQAVAIIKTIHRTGTDG